MSSDDAVEDGVASEKQPIHSGLEEYIDVETRSQTAWNAFHSLALRIKNDEPNWLERQGGVSTTCRWSDRRWSHFMVNKILGLVKEFLAIVIKLTEEAYLV